MAEWRGQQVLYGIIEVIATHHLLKYVRGNGPDERIRMAAGATMAGLGFACGPELEARLRALPNQAAAGGMSRELTYAAGGAALGAVTAYLMRDTMRAAPATPTSPIIIPPTPAITPPPTILPGSLGARLQRALDEADPSAADADPKRPGGLLTLASAGWLGYSLFLDGKTREEQHRHLWGLGAGALGYLYGPEAVRWIRGIRIPKEQGEQAVGILRDGSVLFGAIVGGLAGYGVGTRGGKADA